jgi:hypothetical protein
VFYLFYEKKVNGTYLINKKKKQKSDKLRIQRWKKLKMRWFPQTKTTNGNRITVLTIKYS